MNGSEVWGKNGNTFDPTRFLDETGGIQKNENLIPFSIGKRVCPGETLARVEIFLFFVGMVQSFVFEAEDPANPPPVTRKSGITATPKTFNVKVTKIHG